MRKFYLYKMTNVINEKAYIGITSRPNERRREHFSKGSTCTKLRRAIEKYGKENFLFEVLCVGSEEFILDLEEKAIKAYNSIKNGYNILGHHPNSFGVTVPEDVRERMSLSLLKFYEENPNYLKENRKPRESRYKNIPVFISGFWFPDRFKGMEILGMNKKSFFKRLKEGTLGDTYHENKKSVRYRPYYFLGFWFPTMVDAAAALGKSIDFLQLLLRKGDVEEKLVRVLSKPKLDNSPKSIGVTLRDNGKFRSKMFFKGKKIFDRTFLSEEEAATVYDNFYEDFHGVRPNNTVRA